MNYNELAMNKQDLFLYEQGHKNSTAMVPGILKDANIVKESHPAHNHKMPG